MLKYLAEEHVLEIKFPVLSIHGTKWRFLEILENYGKVITRTNEMLKAKEYIHICRLLVDIIFTIQFRAWLARFPSN